MTRIFAGVAVALAAAFPAISAEPAMPGSAAASAELQIRAIDQQWADAEVKHDEPTLQRILDDHFVFTGADGKTKDKAAFIAEILSSGIASQVVTHDTVYIYGDTAVSVGTKRIASVSQGAEQSNSFGYTAVYVRQSGGWRSLTEQLTASKLQGARP